MHELMHASGFWHEQSRADRDNHVTINWNNIKSGMEYNFLKYDLNRIDHLGASYDTCSVMHYGATAFAKVKLKKKIRNIKLNKIDFRTTEYQPLCQSAKEIAS